MYFPFFYYGILLTRKEEINVCFRVLIEACAAIVSSSSPRLSCLRMWLKSFIKLIQRQSSRTKQQQEMVDNDTELNRNEIHNSRHQDVYISLIKAEE